MSTYIDANAFNAPGTSADNLNPVGGLPIVDPTREYGFNLFLVSLDNTSSGGALNRQAVCLPASVKYAPATLILSDHANTLIEVTMSSPGNIALGMANWATCPVTSAAVMPMGCTYTGIRVTNTGTGAVLVNIGM
jgi:hypothetical protein